MIAALVGADRLRSLIPGAPKMTMLAALLFAASSLLVLGFQHVRRRDPLGAFFIGTLTIAILLTVVYECVSYMSRLLVFEVATEYNPSPGHPSPCTLTGFAFLAIGGFAWAFRRWWTLRMLGAAAAAIGVLGVIGYAFNLPHLYCYFGPDSTAMAFPTAICLAVVGMCEALTPDMETAR